MSASYCDGQDMYVWLSEYSGDCLIKNIEFPVYYIYVRGSKPSFFL